MQILDKGGVFVVNNASFGFSDTDSGQYIGASGLFKVTPTAWLKGQVAAEVFTLVNDEGVPLEGEALQTALAQFPKPVETKPTQASEVKQEPAPAGEKPKK